MNFTVYKSSAGSGKTFTLVKEYLRLALDDVADPPQRYREILAVTFTNKAATEMKERIIRALEELAHPNEGKISAMAEMLTKELSLDQLTIATRARDVLKAILHNYTDFAISTIDSFTHRIVRAFAHDLQLPVNFEVETDSEKLIREAVDILISRIGEDEKLTEVLVQFSENRADDQKSWQVERELNEISKHLLSEEGATHADLLRKLTPEDFLSIRNKLRKVVAIFEERVKEIAGDIFRQMNSSGLNAEDFAYGKNGLAGRIKAYAEGNLDKFGEPNSNIQKAFDSGKLYSGKASASAKDAIESLKHAIELGWTQLEEIRENEFGTYLLRKMLLVNIYALAVLNEIEKIIFNFRAEDNIIHISEFNRIIAKVVFEEPVPFIYERLGEKYSNYLIDEFQDTSVVQWQNLLPLVDNALAGNHFTMLVGDGKQAIYRWRGGEVEQFASLPNVSGVGNNPLVKEREQSLVRNFKGLHLGKNFRSKTEVVTFNNTFFRQLSSLLTPAHLAIYEKLEQESDTKNTGGYIRIEAIQPEERKADELFIEKTVGCIQQLKAEGWSNNQIAVLSRTNREGSMLASALLDAGIPVLSTESLLLRQSPAVNFIVAMLRCIDHPGDELAGAQALEFLVSTKKIPAPLHSRLVEFGEAGKRVQEVIIKNGIDYQPEQLARLPVYQRCEELISLFGLADVFDSYLLFFLDEVLDFSHDRNAEKNGFAEWWEERSKKASVVVPEGMDAVNVMTIHKSKGLEFPVVILPFANWKFKRQKDEFWVALNDPAIPEMKTGLFSAGEKLLQTPLAPLYEAEISKSRLDLMNVLYVAMTRAAQRLYIFTTAVEKISADPRNLDELFAWTLEKAGTPFIENIFESGQPSGAPPVQQLKGIYIRPTVIHSARWENRIRIRSHAGENWDTSNPKGERDKGILFHRLFSFIETKNDLEKALGEMLRLGYCEPSEIPGLKEKAEKILALNELSECFSGTGKIRREKDVLIPGKPRLRPDRVIELKEKTILLDYKTGNPLPDHREQLDRYAAVLETMGYSNIEKKIVYTGTPEVESW